MDSADLFVMKMIWIYKGSDNVLEKLTDEQKDKLANLCEQINYIFTEEENGFTEDNIDEYYDSPLYIGIYNAMYDLEKWN